MQKFSSIEQFKSAKRSVEIRTQFAGLGPDGEAIVDRTRKSPVLDYDGTVKIHGCCISVRIENGVLTCQSREREISVTDDNYGFAKFIAALPQGTLQGVFGDNVVIHGEWAGKGIQPTVAVSQVDKFWTVFSIVKLGEETNYVDIEGISRFPAIYSLNKHRIFGNWQFGVFNISIDFENPGVSVNEMNRLTLEVEKECPVGKFFGISGIGEGIVWRPTDPKWNESRFVFKVKGAEHSASKVVVLATVDTVKVASAASFVEKHLSEGRLQQGFNWLGENKHPQTKQSMGLFIKWVLSDLLKEESDVLVASGLTERDINGEATKTARNWFFNKTKF